MNAFYNEIDPYAAQWLRNLIAAGHIAPGVVDERSIEELDPDELRQYTQCHFFAGIGVWSYALRQAGWSDDRPVWTGSCPCQPFSAAGQGKGFADERHLWPAWFRLIRECRPVTVFGEQVASKDALSWLDHVSTDLEAEGYAIGTVDTCAAGFGAPHIRQRLYFVADAERQQKYKKQQRPEADEGRRGSDGISRCGVVSELADANGRNPGTERQQRSGEFGLQQESDGVDIVGDSENIGCEGQSIRRPDNKRSPGRTACAGVWTNALGNAINQGLEGLPGNEQNRDKSGRLGEVEAGSTTEAGTTNRFWANAEWIPCIDGKARPVEPGTFPLAHGIANRVGRLRAYGNAICALQATEFVRAYADLSR